MGDIKVEDSSGQGAYAFGPFVVDPLKRRLWRDGRLVPITSKTFDVLVVLLERRDHTVSKDELLTRVWPDTAVNENNLARQISSLRRALGQRPDEHDFVVTVPGYGYRFVADVQDLPTVPADPVAETRGYGDPGSAISATRRWRPLGPLVAMASGVVAAVVVITILRPTNPHPQPRRTLQRVTYDEAALPRDAAWAPDGQWVVYAKDRTGSADLWKQRLGDPDPVRLTTSEASESQPQWSPDGQSVVFRSERDGGGLYLIPANGGAERLVSPFGYDPAWSPDGTLVLFKRSVVLPDSPTIYVVGLDGKPPRPVRPDVLGQFGALHAAWHPDGLRISIWGTIAKGQAQFLTVPLDAGPPTTTRMSARVRQDLASVSAGRFVWSRSRQHIYFEGRADDTQNVWRVTVDPSTDRKSVV